MKIAIIGTGGVGGYFGAKIAKAGYDVTFLARGEHFKAIESNGLAVKSILGDFHLSSVKVCREIRDIGKSDLIILAVKAWQIKEISAELLPVLKENSVILPLQNGVSAVDELKVHINEKNIISGLCKIFSKIEAPGIIKHFGVTPTILFGESDNSITSRILEIKKLFDASGINAQISDDINSDVWKKFIPICLGGLMAITRTTYGELRELKETRQMMKALMTEIYQLSQKIGIRIEPDFVDKSVLLLDTYPYSSTASLTRDVLEEKPSEIEYQNGIVVRLGSKYGIVTPVNRFVYDCILPMELKARKTR